jgi:hypothetical protein
VVAILITRSALSPSSSPCSSVVVAAMALLDPPKRLQPEVALNLVRDLLGWCVPAFTGKIRVGASPHGNLAAREFVFFVSNLPSGLALPISSFFMLLLEELGLQPQHFTSCFILQAAIIAYLRRMSVGRCSFPLLPPAFGGKDVHQPCEGGKRAMLRLHLFGFDGFGAASNGGRTRRRTPWRWRSRASSATLLMSSRSYL